MTSTMSESVEREVSRIDHFLRFGSELNVVHFPRRSSFNAFLSSRYVEAPKAVLKSVRNLFESTHNNREEEKRLSERISATVSANSGKLATHSLPLLMVALFNCQTAGEPQSEFRSLAIRLFCSPLLKPLDVLLFAQRMGRKRINASKAVRRALSTYYTQDLNESQTEEILVFGQQFDWSHKDVIRLCHVTPNPLTRQLLRKEDEPTALQKRIQVLRDKHSKSHQLVEALDQSTLEPRFWPRALNTALGRSGVVWRKSVGCLEGDYLLAILPKALKTFPNNKPLFEAFTQRLRQTTEVSSLLKAFVELFLQRNSSSPFQSALMSAVSALRTRPPLEVTLFIDKSVDFERLYLSGLQSKKRRKDDTLDSIRMKDILSLISKTFNCFVAKNEAFIQFSVEDFLHSEDSLPFDSVPEERRKRVLLLSDEQQDISLWPKSADRLVVCHMNRREVKDLGFFRQNVLILNGFDVKWEPMIADFFAEN